MRLGVITLALILFAQPLAAAAQQGKVPKVGYAFVSPPECKVTPLGEAFLQGLRDLGYVPGQNIIVERRCYTMEGELRKLLSEFVRAKVDVIFVGQPAPALAAKNVTRQIPIVCASCGDPVDNGLVTSLARPGGNVTGLASLSAELIAKRLELLKEAVPAVSRVAVLLFPTNPGTRPTLKALDASGLVLGIELQRIEVRDVADFEKAFRSAATGRAGAVLIQDDPLLAPARTLIAELGLRHRLPISTGTPLNADAGALMAYGPDRFDLYRRAAGFVDRILKGAKPSDLPFEQASKYELVINMKTAKALGLAIPLSLRLRADRVIE